MPFRSAFTLLELIIVIVLLGIVGVMSTDIISQTYRNYVYQKEVADLQSRSKQLVDQITQHLERSIKPSVARFDGLATYDSVWDLNGIADANGSFLEWIGKDLESQRGEWNGTMVYPGYSGLANVRDSNGSFVITPDCNLSLIDPIQFSLTNVADPLNGGNLTPRAALYFVYANSGGSVQSRFWNNPTSLFGITQLNIPANGVITVTPLNCTFLPSLFMLFSTNSTVTTFVPTKSSMFFTQTFFVVKLIVGN